MFGSVDRTAVIGVALGTFVAALVTQFVLQILALVSRAKRTEDALKDFDGPPAHWLWGNIKDIGKRHETLDRFVERMIKFKKASKFWFGPFLCSVSLYHPQFIQDLCRSSEPKLRDTYRFVENWIGPGLLTSEGKIWARARRLLTPAFHFDILKPYIKVFGDSTTIMMDKWRSSLTKDGVTSGSFDMFEHVSLMTLDSILKCAFSYDSDVQTQGKDNPYIKAVYDLSELIIKRIRYFPHHFDWIYYFSYNGYRFRKARQVAHDLPRRVIKARRKSLQDKDSDLHHNEKKKRYLDFLDILLTAKDTDGKGLTDEEIQNEVDTFMFEGHDTTASGISWCLYNLARHQEFQELCREEVNTVLGERDTLTWDDMGKFNMLTMCIKESLRLYPPVTGIARKLTKPLTLPDQRALPKDSCVTIPIYGLHHNPEVWDDPERYDPYRFSPENSEGRSPHAFIPFSAGPRNCIGQNFAMNEMKTCIALVLKNYKLQVDESKEILKQAELILRAGKGIWLTVSPVDQ